MYRILKENIYEEILLNINVIIYNIIFFYRFANSSDFQHEPNLFDDSEMIKKKRDLEMKKKFIFPVRIAEMKVK